VDYTTTLDYLYSLQRLGIKLGLDNIRVLLNRLDHPEQRYQSIHVAGTNGKGSVCAGIAAILQRCGFRVGLYTSPHLHAFTERIRINGQPIKEPEVVRLSAEIQQASHGAAATFFEFTTALALLYFHRQKVDWAVIETGMGGRLDATNAVTPAVSVITPVAYDHAEHLGSSLAEIACEKGGIIKQGIPVVIGRQRSEALAPLCEMARNRHSPVFLSGRDFHCRVFADSFDYLGLDTRIQNLRPALVGSHQKENLSLSLAVAEILRRRGSAISLEAMRTGVEAVTWPGRLEWFSGPVPVLLDGAHNRAGSQVLADYLATLETGGIHWVVGAKADKDASALMQPLLPLVSRVYCTQPPVVPSADAAQLQATAQSAGVRADVYLTPAAALEAARAGSRPGEILLVAGSLFLVAAVRELLLEEQKVSA